MGSGEAGALCTAKSSLHSSHLSLETTTKSQKMGELGSDSMPEEKQRRPDPSEFAENDDRALKKRFYRGSHG